MWCPACRADVAAELSLDSRHFRCARCSTELGTAVGSLGAALPSLTQPTDAERNARELLARWNAQNLLESPATPGHVAVNSPVTEPMVVEDAKPASDIAAPEDNRPRRRRKKRRVDWSEELRMISHDSRQAAQQIPANRSGNWGVAIGQVCAYFGIGLITCGTAVVLWGYFGGPPHVAPTGWLVTTVGQMFLFLGVVTLVSSGMEQTSADVAARIDVLGERLIHIESQHRREDLIGRQRRQTPRNRREDSVSDTDDLAARAA